MKIFYAKSTGGFLNSAIHGDDIPHDAVEITSAQRDALMNAQISGKVIVANGDGEPIAIDGKPLSAEQLANFARISRDALLVASDWVTLRAVETGTPAPSEWSAYRQALRDVPEQADFPHEIDWPVPPA